jgi:DNA gyrase/topoisomerase IV subunit A
MQLAPKAVIVGASVLSASEDVLLVAESGRTARVTPDDLPLVARDRKGVAGIKLEASDTLKRMVVLPG